MKKNTITNINAILMGNNIEYVLIRDKYRSLRLRVKNDGSIEMRAPHSCSSRFIDAFLQKKGTWIFRKKQEILEYDKRPIIAFNHGDACYCLGEKFTWDFQEEFQFLEKSQPFQELQFPNEWLNSQEKAQNAVITPPQPFNTYFLSHEIAWKEFKVFANSSHPKVNLNFAQAHIHIKPQLSETSTRNILIKWRKISAERFLERCFHTIWAGLCENQAYIPSEIKALFQKIKKPHLKIRTLTRRFGSCSTKGEICLARHLVGYPLAYIEYIIVHEYCHCIHMNHSPKFYALLNTCLPHANIFNGKHDPLRLWSKTHPQF